MVRFYRSTVSTVSESDVVIIGVSDESKSLATRKGTSRAPDIIRAASNELEFFKRAGKISFTGFFASPHFEEILTITAL